MIYRNACMSDVLSVSTQRDSCVVLPTLEHATYWWPRIGYMHEERQEVRRSKTGYVLMGSRTILRLWTPYEPEPTQPMDFIHDDVFRMDYLLLFGLSKRRDVRWV